jgi:hypothetical protein
VNGRETIEGSDPKAEETLEEYFVRRQKSIGAPRLKFGTVEDQETDYLLFCAGLTPLQSLQYATMLIKSAFADQLANSKPPTRLYFDSV